MGLICNGYRFGHMPHAVRTGALTTIYNGRGFRDMVITGRLRNITAGEGITSEKVGIPMGYLHPGAWILPQKPGNLSSHNNARGEASCAATAFWTMRGSVAGVSAVNGSGYVVAQGSGAADGISTVGGVLGGFAWCAGIIYGIAIASMNSYATGSLSGHIYVNQSEATVEQIVDGVWDCDAVDHDISGTMGEAVNAAGTAGDPWSTTLPGAYTPGQAGYMFGQIYTYVTGKLLTVAKFLGLK